MLRGEGHSLSSRPLWRITATSRSTQVQKSKRPRVTQDSFQLECDRLSHIVDGALCERLRWERNEGPMLARLVALAHAAFEGRSEFELIEEGAKAALADLAAVTPYDPGSPCTIEVEFTRTSALDEYTRKPGVVLVGERTITSTAETWWDAWQQFFLR